MIDRGEEVLWQREGCANSRGMLKATQIKAVFARIVREAVSNLGYQRYHSISKDFVLSVACEQAPGSFWLSVLFGEKNSDQRPVHRLYYLGKYMY